MNDRLGRTLALLTVLAVACPATIRGADSSQSSPAASSASSAPDKAAEAKRLASMAAELAQRASELAADSQATTAPAAAANPAEKPSSAPKSTKQAWASRDGAEVRISDSDQSASSSTSKSSWRSHQKAADVAIRFKDDSSSATGKSGGAGKSTANEAKQIAAEIQEHGMQHEPKSEPAAADRRPVNDENVQLVSRTYQDDNMSSNGTHEPLPAARDSQDSKNSNSNSQYNNKNADFNSNGNCSTCNGGSCDNCCDMGCCEPQRMLFWTAGVEATFLNPDLNEHGVGFEMVETSKQRDDFCATNESADLNSLYIAPRIWLGVQGCCWGADVKYWHFRANQGSFDPTLGFDGEWDGKGCGTPDLGFVSCSDLDMWTLDLEFSRRVCLNQCQMQFSAGVRHAEVSQDDLLTASALADDSQVLAFGRSNRFMQGTGIVLGWYGRRPIFPCSCVNWFYNLHLSTLWGPVDTSVETGVELTANNIAQGATANAGSINGASTHVDDTLVIGEVQLGLEWDYPLRCLPANAFFRAALEYQRWDGGKGFSAADSFAGVTINNNPSTLASVAASAANPDVDLFGFSLGTGLTW